MARFVCRSAGELQAEYELIIDEVQRVVIGQRKVFIRSSRRSCHGGTACGGCAPGCQDADGPTIARIMTLSFKRSSSRGPHAVGHHRDERDRRAGAGPTEFRFVRGRCFANIIWPMRSTAPAQDAGGPAPSMQEREVTVRTGTYPLPNPFF